MANPTLPIEEPSEFDGMPAEAVAAFVFREGGEQALRQMLQMADEAEPHNREDLEQIAKALELRGLSAPATILREIAAETKSELERCPYKSGHNRTQWLHSRRVTRDLRSGKIEARLRRKAGLKAR